MGFDCTRYSVAPPPLNTRYYFRLHRPRHGHKTCSMVQSTSPMDFLRQSLNSESLEDLQYYSTDHRRFAGGVGCSGPVAIGRTWDSALIFPKQCNGTIIILQHRKVLLNCGCALLLSLAWMQECSGRQTRHSFRLLSRLSGILQSDL